MKNVRELLQVNEEPLPRLYCDMDQVLCAFLTGAKQILGSDFQKSDRNTRWEKIAGTKGSAYTDRDSRSKGGKIKWVQKNTKIPKSRTIVVLRSQKQRYATQNGQFCVLIDDYIKNIKEWENKGGVGIHHTDVNKTLKELTNLGYK